VKPSRSFGPKKPSKQSRYHEMMGIIKARGDRGDFDWLDENAGLLAARYKAKPEAVRSLILAAKLRGSLV